MTQIDLGPLNEDCIALRDGLACKCEEDGQPVLALTLRQIASRYQRLLNKLFAEQANDAAEKRVAELQAALDAERAAHAWRPFHVNGDHPIGVPIEAIIVVEDDPDNLTWVFDVRFWRPAAPQEPR